MVRSNLKVKIWQPYFMSITYDSNSTDKLEVDGALILPPTPSVPCSVRVFKAGQVKLINNR